MPPEEDNSILEEALAALESAVVKAQKDRNLAAITAKDLGTILAPIIKQIAETNRATVEEVKTAIAHIKMPEMPAFPPYPEPKAPIVNVPEPRVHVTSPEVHVPAPIVQVPPPNFPNKMDVAMPSITQKSPLPVQVINQPAQTKIMSVSDVLTSIAATLVDSSGVQYSGSNPLPTTASVTLSAAVGQGDGASALRVIQAGDSVSSVIVNSGSIVVTSITASTAAALVDSSGVAYSGSNPLPTTASVTLTADYGSGEIGTNTLRTVQATNAVSSVFVTGANGTLAANIVDSSGVAYSGSNPLPTTASVTLTADYGSGEIGTNTLRTVMATNAVVSISGAAVAGLNETTSDVLRMVRMSDNVSSTNVVTFNGNTPAIGLNETGNGVLRVVMMTDANSSVNVTTFNGNAPAVGLNTTTNGVLRTVIMTDSITSANIVTFNGNAPSVGTNETQTGVLRMIQMSDTVTSSNIVTFAGNAPALGLNETVNGVLRTVLMSDTANSSQEKAIAMTTNPTAASDAASAFVRSDKLGRLVMRPMHVRDLISTAYVSLSTGTEATLLAGTAGEFHDLIYIMAANTSNAAIQVDVRAVTAGNIVMTLEIPASATQGVSLPVPFPQDNQDNNWTVDMGDFTNTTIDISALFSREI